MLCIDLLDAISKWQGWTAVAALVAAIYTALTYRLLRKNNKIAEFQTYMKIAEALNSDAARDIIDACIDNKLNVDSNFPSGTYCITGGHFRRNVLDPLEDLSKFCEDGLISINSVDSGFGYLILEVGNCESVISHLKQVRKKSPDAYRGFENLYQKIIKRCTPSLRRNYRKDFK